MISLLTACCNDLMEPYIGVNSPCNEFLCRYLIKSLKLKLSKTTASKKGATMKWFMFMSVALSIAVPTAMAAQDPSPSLKDIQQPCKLKQVTHRCEIVTDKQTIKGICIDAKRYGLICSERK